MRTDRWRFAWAWTIAALLVLPACIPPGKPPGPPTKPTPAPPYPVCVEGQASGCWHNPGTGWLYACSTPWVPGGVTNTPTGPGACPSSPEQPPNPPPAPPTTGCVLAGEPGGDLLPAYVSPVLADGKRLGDHVNAKMAALTGCSIGSTCVVTVPPQVWQAHVAQALRESGFCAGQHTPTTDEVEAQHPDTKALEGFHVYRGDGWDNPSATGTVVWYQTITGTIPQGGPSDPFRGAARPAYAPRGGGVVLPPSPVPPPPPPTPPTGGCGNPLPPRVWTAETLPDGWGHDQIGKPRWLIECLPHGNVIDCTAKIAPQACGYCASIDMATMPDGVQPRCGCPARKEDHPERKPCEEYLTGGTKLQVREKSGATCSFAHGNPFQFEPSGGNCRLCSSDGAVCGGWF